MKKITVATTVKAPISTVWEYWTKPDHIMKWNFASSEWFCPRARNDVKPGGEFNWRMEARDGSMGFDFSGVYDQVKENELITYRISDGRRVEIRFTERMDEVSLSESFEAEETNAEEMQRAGWQAILDHFKQYTERNL